MRDISVAELYDLYLDTVGRCTSDVKGRSDDEIQYDLFEEFDVGAHSFLHEDSLDKLRRAGYIDDQSLQIGKDVRKRWLALQDRPWTVADIKSNKEWQELFDLCDRLKSGSNR